MTTDPLTKRARRLLLDLYAYHDGVCREITKAGMPSDATTKLYAKHLRLSERIREEFLREMHHEQFERVLAGHLGGLPE
jgi:hypothetical protein